LAIPSSIAGTPLAALGVVADGFLPLGQLAWEIVLGLGVALAAGSIAALVRPNVVERRSGQRQPRPPDPRRVRRNAVIGVVVAIIGALGLTGVFGK
jgi:hypothetical protein